MNESPEATRQERLSRCYEFGPFVLDITRRLLIRELKPVALTPKTYDALVVLVESRGRFLSKSELMKSLWPDSFVEDSNLTQQISMVRKALGEVPGDDRYIVTVPGRGYRFVAQVKESTYDSHAANGASAQNDDKIDTGTDAETVTETPGADGSRAVELGPSTTSIQTVGAWAWLQRPYLALSALVILGIALIALGYALHRRVPVGTKSFSRPRSLAILPFRNLKSDNDSDFLGFSLADAVAARLSYISELTVRPSSAVERYRNQVIDIQRVAAELNVDTLLTGNFIRDGDDLRITSELIDVRTQRILWKRAFDLRYNKLLTVEETVARQIVNGLELNLSPSEAVQLRADRPADPLAYEFYLRGVDLYSRNDFLMAIKMLEKSAELNPNYALTWAYLGKAIDATASFQFGGREPYRKAEAAYEKALSLEPAQIETRVYMANMFTDTGRVEQAVPLLRQALKVNPNNPEAHWELGYAYRFAGALNESVSECERARQLDPGVKASSSALNTYLYLGQYGKFLQSLPKGEDLALMVFYRGFGNYYNKDWERAAVDFDRAFELDRSLLQSQVGKALSYSIQHQGPKGLEILRAAEEKINQRGVGDPEAMYKVAQAYSMLGSRAPALRVLQSSISGGFFPYPYFMKDPLLNSIRSENGFDQLMAIARRRHESFKSKFL